MSYPPPSVPSDSPPSAGERPKIKPGKGWYWVGGLLLVVGLIGGAVLGLVGVLNLKNSIEDFGRFKVENGAGAATVTFEKPGEYSIYYESESKVCGDLGATGAEPCETVAVQGEDDPPAQLDIAITSGDRSLPIGPAENSLDYSFSGFSGTEVATVDVDEAGAYSMVVETRREGEFAIALGKDVVSTILPWILGALALAAVGLILGLLTLILTAVKRRRRKREAAMAAATAYPTAPAVFTPVAARPPPAPAPAPVPPVVPVPPIVPTPTGAPPPPRRRLRRPFRFPPGTTPRSPPRRVRTRGRRPPPRRHRRRLERHPSPRRLQPRFSLRSRARRMTARRRPTTRAGASRRPPRPPTVPKCPRHRLRPRRRLLPGRTDRRLRRSRRPPVRRRGAPCRRPLLRHHRPPEPRPAAPAVFSRPV